MSRALGIFALALAAGCHAERAHVGPASPSLNVWPAAASLSPGDPIAFAADHAVAWTVEETGGGAIDDTGLYVAPSAPGLYHVRATTTDATSPALATVAVVDVAPRALDLFAGLPCGEGSVDGVGVAVHFAQPIAVAADGHGHLFVTDNELHTIRQVELGTNRVTSIAGDPALGGDHDGLGAAARFRTPEGLAADGDGWLYVADTDNAIVRRVWLPTGEVTTLAGSGDPHIEGAEDGVGSAARFTIPQGTALDGHGKLYLADPENNEIRAIDPATATVTTLAGHVGPGAHVDGVGSDARFDVPLAVAWGGGPTLYVIDREKQLVRTIDIATATVGTLAQLDDFPTAIAARGATVWVTTASAVLAVDASSGAIATLAGSPTDIGFLDGAALSARFGHLAGLAVAGDFLYAADRDNHVLRAIAIADGTVTTALGCHTTDGADGSGYQAHFQIPLGAAADTRGNLYVSDSANHTIREIFPDGTVTTFAGAIGQPGNTDGVGGEARFNHPAGLAVVDDDHLYVADSDNALLRRIDLSTVEVKSQRGLVTTIAGGGAVGADGTGTAAGFFNPVGLTYDGAGRLFLTDLEGETVRQIDLATMAVTTLAGDGLPGGYDGTGTDARFNGPAGIAADRLGHLYVGDGFGRTVRQITIATGDVFTFAGEYTAIGAHDGSGPFARFSGPGAIASDGAGNVWVADQLNHAVRRIVRRIVSTPVGNLNDVFGVELAPLPAQVGSPTGLALMPNGQLVVLDENAVLIVR